MAYLNRVKVLLSGTPGTSATVTLGAADTGFQSFTSAGATVGFEYSYVIEEGTTWEYGKGVYASATTFTRTTVYSNSSGTTSRLDFTSDAKLFVTIGAEDAASPIGELTGFIKNDKVDSRYLEANGNVVLQSAYPELYTKVGTRVNNSNLGDWGYSAFPGFGASTRVRAVAYGNNRLVAMAEGGFTFYSTNGGTTWSAGGTVSTAYISEPLMLFHNGDGFLSVAANGYVAYTTDGVTWNQRGQKFTNFASGDVCKISGKSGEFIVVNSYSDYSTESSLFFYRTTDNGVNFTTHTATFSPAIFIEAGPMYVSGITWTGSLYFFSGTYSTSGTSYKPAYYTSSNGTNWTQVEPTGLYNTITTSSRAGNVVTIDGTIYISSGDTSGQTLYTSTNNGTSFTNTSWGINSNSIWFGGKIGTSIIIVGQSTVTVYSIINNTFITHGTLTSSYSPQQHTVAIDPNYRTMFGGTNNSSTTSVPIFRYTPFTYNPTTQFALPQYSSTYTGANQPSPALYVRVK